MPNYLEAFAIPAANLPPLLVEMLSPITSLDADLMVKITMRVEKKDESEESCYMVMASVPEKLGASLEISDAVGHGVVAYSTPDCGTKGGLDELAYNIDGFDYLVASWGDGSFYTYNLAEKLWMTLGLSQRCVGSGEQRVIYDDLSAPRMGVAQGRISNEFYWEQSRDVEWSMRNDYLREYLWMRGHIAARSFYYRRVIDDTPPLRAIMNGKDYFEKKEAWCEIDVREYEGRLLLQVWATVPAIAAEKIPARDVYSLTWPGDAAPMTKTRSRNIRDEEYPFIYLKDTFLKKYESDSVYAAVPSVIHGRAVCGPTYKGQWSLRIERHGRNLLKATVKDIFEGVPTREILHAYDHAISPARAGTFDPDEENIVHKVSRLVGEITTFGDLLIELAGTVGGNIGTAEDCIGLSSQKLQEEGWPAYPVIVKLMQAAPLDMSEAEFLDRCKTLNELIQRIVTGPLQELLRRSGIANNELQGLRNLKLLQGLKNITSYLVKNRERITDFTGAGNRCDWKKDNTDMAPIFINNDLRQASAHEIIGKCIEALERLGFDSAQLGEGYGRALDFVLDGVIESFKSLNTDLENLLPAR